MLSCRAAVPAVAEAGNGTEPGDPQPECQQALVFDLCFRLDSNTGSADPANLLTERAKVVIFRSKQFKAEEFEMPEFLIT